jgi:hypothetical protein
MQSARNCTSSEFYINVVKALFMACSALALYQWVIINHNIIDIADDLVLSIQDPGYECTASVVPNPILT